MTFIDDATSHCAVMQLKRKSDAFDAFKTYKAFAENHFQWKMKEFLLKLPTGNRANCVLRYANPLRCLVPVPVYLFPHIT